MREYSQLACGLKLEWLISRDLLLTLIECLTNLTLRFKSWFGFSNFLKVESRVIHLRKELTASSPCAANTISTGNDILGLSLDPIPCSLENGKPTRIYFKPEHMIKTKTELMLQFTELLMTEK